MNLNTLLNAFIDWFTNEKVMLILMVVLSVFVVLLLILAIVFIIALRKRRPVVKVVMAPAAQQAAAEEPDDEDEEEQSAPAAEPVLDENGEVTEAPAPVPQPEPEDDEDDDDEEEGGSTFITEGSERVRYNRSFTAKICQQSNETKEWYSELKNELLSYERVRARMSWKRESFRIGRLNLARLVVRGKTLCLLLAVEPISYTGTKYTVEDVSNVASTADTPTLYRIKSARRLKYAKEMLEGIMREVKTYKKPDFEAQDYFLPYEGDMALIQRGLIKRVVSGSTRTFKVEEVDAAEAEKATKDDEE